MTLGYWGKKTNRSKPIEYFDAFLRLIPKYCEDRDHRLVGRPEEWQSLVISYSFYLGLGISILDEELRIKLLEGISPGMRQTSDLVLKELDQIKKTHHCTSGLKWNHAVSTLNHFVSLTSPETTGANADQKLVRTKASISGFVPGLRLSNVDKGFSHATFRDAVEEHRKCDEKKLLARIEDMKRIVDAVMA